MVHDKSHHATVQLVCLINTIPLLSVEHMGLRMVKADRSCTHKTVSCHSEAFLRLKCSYETRPTSSGQQKRERQPTAKEG